MPIYYSSLLAINVWQRKRRKLKTNHINKGTVQRSASIWSIICVHSFVRRHHRQQQHQQQYVFAVSEQQSDDKTDKRVALITYPIKTRNKYPQK